MKRGLLALSVVAVVVCVCGMAFAADTVDYTPAPTVPEVQQEVGGGTVTDVVGGKDALNDVQQGALQLVFDEAGKEAGNVEVAKVTVTFPATGSITVKWADGQLFFNFDSGKFDTYANRYRASTAEGTVSAMATEDYSMTKDSPYIDSADGSDSGTFVSVKGATQTGSGGGGGCSMLTLGAVALFLLPALALTKRKK